jgi:hypothetical protein
MNYFLIQTSHAKAVRMKQTQRRMQNCNDEGTWISKSIETETKSPKEMQDAFRLDSVVFLQILRTGRMPPYPHTHLLLNPTGMAK